LSNANASQNSEPNDGIFGLVCKAGLAARANVGETSSPQVIQQQDGALNFAAD
jgi:hypothetical protein